MVAELAARGPVRALCADAVALDHRQGLGPDNTGADPLLHLLLLRHGNVEEGGADGDGPLGRRQNRQSRCEKPNCFCFEVL